MQPFAVDVELHGRECTVHVAGELDVATRDRVRDRFEALGSPTVVVDLQTLTFVDASGLSALVAAKRAVVERGGTWRLRGARGIVRRVIRAAALTEELGCAA